MRIALASLNIKWRDAECNALKIKKLAKQAAKYYAELIVFPEMSLTGFSTDLRDYLSVNEALSLIGHVKIDTVFGMGARDGKKFFNRLIWLGSNGDMKVYFDKLHAFKLAGEKVVTLGAKLATYNYLGINFGFGICYDLRFYETFSRTAAICDAFIVSACWPKTRVDEWKTLIKARAIENQAIVIGVNRSGTEPNAQYSKSSFVAYPDGSTPKPVFDRGELAVYDVDFEVVKLRRTTFNTLNDRRLELI